MNGTDPTRIELEPRDDVSRPSRHRILLLLTALALVVVSAVTVVIIRQPRGSVATPAGPTLLATTTSTMTTIPATPTPTTSPVTASSGPVVMFETSLMLRSVEDIQALSWLEAEGKAFLVEWFTTSKKASPTCGPNHVLLIHGYRLPDLIDGEEGADGCRSSVDYLWGRDEAGWRMILWSQQTPLCFQVRSAGWAGTIPQTFLGGFCELNWSGSSDDPTFRPYTPAPSPSVPRGTAFPGQTEGSVIPLATPLTLSSRADIEAVSWLADDAKAFLAVELEGYRSFSGVCRTAQLRIDAYRVGDLISGSILVCGERQVLWGRTGGGAWRDVVFAGGLGQPATPSCWDIRVQAAWRATIPAGFVGAMCRPDFEWSSTPIPYTP